MKKKISNKTVVNPLQIEVQRGGFRESLHIVHAVVIDSLGKVVLGWGNIDLLTFPRSAIKPLQAIPLILSGAAEHFSMSSEELAMACSFGVHRSCTMCLGISKCRQTCKNKEWTTAQPNKGRTTAQPNQSAV